MDDLAVARAGAVADAGTGLEHDRFQAAQRQLARHRQADRAGPYHHRIDPLHDRCPRLRQGSISEGRPPAAGATPRQRHQPSSITTGSLFLHVLPQTADRAGAQRLVRWRQLASEPAFTSQGHGPLA